MKHILILGGGFAGLSAAVNAADEIIAQDGDIKVTLVSRNDFLTMRPRLYERDPESLRAPLRPVLDPIDVTFVAGDVREIDTEAQFVVVQGRNGAVTTLDYDRLILATGSELRRLPVPGMAEHGWNIDNFDSAVAFDRHLRTVAQMPEVPGHGTFVIVGAGMSGIEIATELRGRIEAHSDSRTAARARVVLIEQADRVGPEFGDEPRPVIEDALRRADVETRLGATVTGVDADGVTLSDGERIATATTIVTVGLRANALAEQVPAPRDELGRLHVDRTLRVDGVPEVYTAGDVARAHVDDENVALMSCQHARTMGKYAGLNAARDLLGLPQRPYRQERYVTCLDLGASGAVLTSGWSREVELTGPEAKARKQFINTQLIYPPASGDADEIRAALRIDEDGR